MRIAHDGLDLEAREELKVWFKSAYAESRLGEGAILPFSHYVTKNMDDMHIAPSDLLHTFRGHTQAEHIRDWYALGADFTASAVDTPLLAYDLKHGEMEGLNTLLSLGVPTDFTVERQYFELPTDATHPPRSAFPCLGPLMKNRMLPPYPCLSVPRFLTRAQMPPWKLCPTLYVKTLSVILPVPFKRLKTTGKAIST